MPGKAVSTALQAQKLRSCHNELMQKAVIAYRAEQEKPEEEWLEARVICEMFT